ncbi:hypothetical protein J4G08_03550 [Candidatus Poribacteria bacterium]|nr:hypothetical protein [Candidatus Poribacteria bacterium]
MLKVIPFLLTLLIMLLSVQFCYAEEVDNKIVPTESEQSIRLISPIGTMVRSTVFPGWGQFHSRNYFRGSLVLLGIGSSVVGTFLAHQSFATEYDNYIITAGYDPDDPAVLVSYDKANQRYKLKMFFIYTGIGVWAYSIIDSYVSANFYNANSQIRSIQEDAQHIEKLGLQVGITPSRLYLGVVKTF